MAGNRLLQIARKLTTAQLQQETGEGFSLNDLPLFDVGRRGSDRFLGFYSRQGLCLALKKYGLFKALERHGFQDVHVHIDTNDPFLHRLRLDDHGLGHKQVLGELVVRKENMRLSLPINHPLARKSFPMLTIEWLFLQDCRKEFDSAKPRLPGQEHPGLGMARPILELLLVVCWRLNLSGLLHNPAHFHNAIMGNAVFSFTNPKWQARFEALKRDLAPYHLQAASWGLAWNCVIDGATQQPTEWKPKQMMVALDRHLKRYLSSFYYLHTLWQHEGHYQFQLNEESLKSKASQSDVFIPRIRKYQDSP